jgi:hypothetical protein
MSCTAAAVPRPGTVKEREEEEQFFSHTQHAAV